MASRSQISKVINTGDQKRVEQEHQCGIEIQTVFQKLVDSSMDGILAFDKEGRYTVWNPALERIFGINQLQRLGKEATDLCPFFRQTGGMNCYREALAGKGVLATDIPYTFAETGKQIFLDGHFSPLLDDGGNIIGGLAIIRDVTERKQVEWELRQLVDAVPQHMAIIASDGRLIYGNKVALDFHGYNLEQFLDENSLKTKVDPRDLANYLDVRQRGLARGLPFETEVRLLSKSGAYRWFLVLFNPLLDGQDHVLRWYATATDIQDRKQAEEALRRSEDRLKLLLEFTNKLITKLELRDLLRAVAGSLRKVIACDAIGVFLPHSDGDSLRSFVADFPETKGFLREELQVSAEKRTMALECPLAAMVFRTGKTWIGNDDDLLQLGFKNALALAEGLKTGCVLPILCCDRVLAVLAVGRREAKPFDPYEVDLLRQVADQVAIAIVNALAVEDRKQAENALRRSEAYLAEAQRLSHTGSFGWDVSSEEINWSAETFRIFEFGPKAKVTIQLIMQRTHPEDRPAVQQLIERVSRERTDFDVEHRLLMPNGCVKYVHVVGHPSTDEWGCFEFVGAVTDITERKQAEAALLRGAQQLATQKAQLDELFEQAPEGIVLLDVEDRILRINPEFTRIFGYTPDEAIGRLINDLIAPEELLSEAEEYTHRIIHGKPVNAETIRRRKDGKRIHISLLAVPISVPGGGQIAEYAIYRDITERRRAEEALRRSEAYLAEAQRLSHTGSFAHDAVRGEILYWSPEAYRIFGFDPAKGPISYQEARSRIHPDDLQKFDEARERGIREKTGAKIDFRIVLPDGSVKHVHCLSHPSLNASGEVVELVGTNMDVTEQHEARAALEKAFEEIKQLKDELYRENLALKDEIDQASMFEEIVGTSEALRRILVQVAKVAPTDSTVLIAGETGTGKELIARAIHRRSQRSSKTFVSVNCAAIPAGLIGSELFGHEKGAFTGATQRRLGRFELADGGTLFLDEVGDLPPETQIALLRVLQERQLERVGGTHSIAVNVRIIAATNRDLKAAVAAGTFRSDLFYRLNVFPLTVPSLRDRKNDIPLLVEYLTERYASKAGKKIKNIQKRTLELFQAYDWPGNIRELQNVIERAVILCDGETFSVDESWLESESARANERGNGLARLGAEQERKLIESALAQSRGRIAGPSGAAAKLGIPRSTLETKIARLGIVKHRFKSG